MIPLSSSRPLMPAAVSGGTRPYLPVVCPPRASMPFPAALRTLLRPHQLYEALEQVVAVARTGRGFRVVLHREYRLVLECDAAVGAVEQRHVGLGGVRRQGRAVDREAVVHRGDLDLAGAEVFDRMIGAVVALVHLQGLGADRDAEHLVAGTD